MPFKTSNYILTGANMSDNWEAWLLTRRNSVGRVRHDWFAESLHIPGKHTDEVFLPLLQMWNLVVGPLEVIKDLFPGQWTEVVMTTPLHFIACDNSSIVVQRLVKPDEKRWTVCYTQRHLGWGLGLPWNMDKSYWNWGEFFNNQRYWWSKYFILIVY